MWSQRVQYAIRVLIALAAQRTERVPARVISSELGMPLKYLETILGDLRQSGFVRSTKGKSGGYQLAHEPSTIRLLDVVRALEPGWLGTAASRSDTASPAGTFPEEPVLYAVQENVRRELSRVTVADALMRWYERRRTLSYSI